MPRHKKRKEDEWNTPKARCKFVFSQSWCFVFSLTISILSLFIFLWHPDKEFERAPAGLYIVVVMASFWMFESIPLAITSLLPVALGPLFGLTSSDDICSVYFTDTIIFLFGGCVTAQAFEYSNLHTRIALFVMKSCGAHPSILLFGIMTTCALLSCWMNNISTTAMMVPVIFSIMDQYKKKLLPDGTPEQMAAEVGIPKEPPSDNPVQMVNGGDIPPVNVFSNTPAEKNDEHGNTVSDTVPKEKSALDLNSVTSEEELENAGSFWTHEIESKKKYIRNVEVMFLVGVAFSTNIGGTGVLTGTGTNLIGSSQLSTYQSKLGKGDFGVKDITECLDPSKSYWSVDFLSWSVLNFFPMIVNSITSWFFLAFYFQGLPESIGIWWRRTVLKRKIPSLELKLAEEKAAVAASIRDGITEQYKALGSTTFHERVVLILFSTLVMLWIFRSPSFLRGPPKSYLRTEDGLDDDTLALVHPACASQASPKLKLESTWGWSRFCGDKCDELFVHDYVPTLLVCILMFILPKEVTYYKNIFQGGLDEGLDDPLLPLEYAAKNMPFGPLFMLGGGFAMAQIIDRSQLGDFLKVSIQNSEFLVKLDVHSIMIVILVLVGLMTTITSNTATAVIVSPVLINLAQIKGVPPLYMLVTPIVGASYSFIVPISTPPNAIVYDKANMKQTDMLVPGFVLSIICNAIQYFFTITWIHAMLDVGTYSGACNLDSATANARSLVISEQSIQ